MTFEELVAKSLEHAAAAEDLIAQEMAGGTIAAIHATLAEAFARLASAVIVNRTSLHVAAEQQPRRPVS